MKKNWQFEFIFAYIGVAFIIFALKLSESNMSLAWFSLIGGILVLLITVVKKNAKTLHSKEV